jgi:hypothetical protein
MKGASVLSERTAVVATGLWPVSSLQVSSLRGPQDRGYNFPQ